MKHSPFFLTGAPKSGTTWLGKLLDAHPEINCRGEACVHHFGMNLVAACKGYNELLAKRRSIITDSNDFPQMPWSEVLSLMRTFIEHRLETIADPHKPRLRFLGEKDPEHAMHLPILDQLFPEAKFIHIIRDGRGVFISAWHHNVRTQDVNLQTLGFDDFLDITAKEWSDRVTRARKAAAPLGDRYCEVRYEDLVKAPLQELSRLLRFLGADSGEPVVQTCVDAASFEKLSQGRKAGEEDASSFFRKGDPDDWRNQLTPAQVSRFIRLSGTTLADLGYES